MGKEGGILILFGIYYPYWEKEWGGDARIYIERAKKLGFDILEVATADFTQKPNSYFSELRKIAEDNEIILTGGYGPDKKNDISTDDTFALENALESYRLMFSQMEAAGIRLLGGALYSYWPVNVNSQINKAADFERSVAGMKKLADIAADFGIELNMEALNRFEGYLINTAHECIEYVNAVDKSNVHVMLDTFHMNLEEDSLTDAIESAGNRLGHFHVGEANRKPPRPGRMNWPEIGNALKRIHYDGCVVMEPFVVPGGSVGRDIRIWRSLFEDVSTASLDQIAAESVRYLKEAFS